VHAQHRLPLDILDRDKSRVRAPERLADRFGVVTVIEVVFAIRASELRRDELDRVPELCELARPVMGAVTRLYANQARLESGEELQKLAAPQRLAEHPFAVTVDAVPFEHLLLSSRFR